MLVSDLIEHTDKLLAPNGKPSNLSPEHYKLVRSVKFKKWFGDWENDPANSSKILDKNGEPLLVYHSSGVAGIKKFKPSHRGLIFFATTKEGALRASVNSRSHIYEAFLNVRKPKGSSKPGAGMYFGDAENPKTQEKLKSQDVDGIYIRDEAKGTIGVFDNSQIRVVSDYKFEAPPRKITLD